MAHVSAALAGGSNYPGGVPGLAGLGVAGALAVPPASAAVLAANKVMRELHVGGLPHGVSGVQLQVRERARERVSGDGVFVFLVLWVPAI